VCQKPSKVEIRSKVSGVLSDPRTTEYEYDAVSKLVTKITVQDPSNPASTVAYNFEYDQAPGYAWSAWLPTKQTGPDSRNCSATGTWDLLGVDGRCPACRSGVSVGARSSACLPYVIARA
jgi:hypothetical protein